MPNNTNERKGKQAGELSAEERFRNFFSTSVIDLPEEMTRRDEPAPVEEKPKAGLLGKLFSHDKEETPAPAQPVLEIPTGEILLGADAKPVQPEQEDMALELRTADPVPAMPMQPASPEPAKAVPAEPVPAPKAAAAVQPEPEKPKKKKLLSVGIGAALIVAVLVTSVVAFSFGQSGKPADNVPDPPQREEVQTPSDTDTPSDESTDTEKPEDTTPSDSAQETPSTSGKQEIDPSTGKDKYQTDPVPDGKPAPAEPEDAEVDTSTKYTCTISITCKTILDNMDKVKESKKGIVPSDGIILDTTTVTFSEGESVFNVLQRTCRERGIHMESSWTPIYNSAYVEGIANLYEFDVGSQSGWMYKVNGWFPNYGCSRYALQQGDEICWMYTCVRLGEDIGGGYAAGG